MTHSTFRWLVLLLIPLTGCSFWQKTPTAQATGYKKVELEYRADARQVKLSARQPAVEGQLVSYQEPAQPLPEEAITSLHLRYPHPKLGADWAVVEVRIEAAGKGENPAQPGGNWWSRQWNKTRDAMPGLKGSGWRHETWTLDMPQEELDPIIARLRAQGYFEKDVPGAATTRLECRLDGRKTKKTWQQVPELDRLVDRIRTDGKLTASSLPPRGTATAVASDSANKTAGPTAAAPAGKTPIDSSAAKNAAKTAAVNVPPPPKKERSKLLSLAAYRKLLAQDAKTTASNDTAASTPPGSIAAGGATASDLPVNTPAAPVESNPYVAEQPAPTATR